MVLPLLLTPGPRLPSVKLVSIFTKGLSSSSLRCLKQAWAQDVLLYNAASLPTCSVVGASRLGLVVVASVVLVDVSRAALAQAETVVGSPVTRNTE